MNLRILLLTGLIVSTSFVQGGQKDRYPLVAVEDGDTVTVQIGSVIKRLQLLGIDAPEDAINPKLTKDLGRTGLSSDTLLGLGKIATAHLKQLVVPGDTIRVTGDLAISDKYGRIPAIIYTKGHRSLNEQMVADGYAIGMGQSAVAQEIKEELLSLQQQAQREKRGLWGSHNHETLSWSGQHPPK